MAAAIRYFARFCRYPAGRVVTARIAQLIRAVRYPRPVSHQHIIPIHIQNRAGQIVAVRGVLILPSVEHPVSRHAVYRIFNWMAASVHGADRIGISPQNKVASRARRLNFSCQSPLGICPFICDCILLCKAGVHRPSFLPGYTVGVGGVGAYIFIFIRPLHRPAEEVVAVVGCGGGGDGGSGLGVAFATAVGHSSIVRFSSTCNGHRSGFIVIRKFSVLAAQLHLSALTVAPLRHQCHAAVRDGCIILTVDFEGKSGVCRVIVVGHRMFCRQQKAIPHGQPTVKVPAVWSRCSMRGIREPLMFSGSIRSFLEAHDAGSISGLCFIGSAVGKVGHGG